MATTSPALIPPAGLRALSAKEQLQRAAALNCVAEGAGKPACVGQVFVGIFFDGTGNNKKLDFDEPPPEKRKHTNVVKLFQAFRDDPGQGYFRFYVPGVGTPFPEIGEMTASANGARFKPIQLTDEELSHLIAAGEPDALTQVLSEHFSDLLPKEGRAELHRTLQRLCTLARRCGVERFARLQSLAVAVLGTRGALLDDPKFEPWLQLHAHDEHGFEDALAPWVESAEEQPA
ncbi:MAG: DUF2235 domain-containing protein [Burkholderiaceae bacterium]|nr:DUF2235 domain-containing protein [Aquabacterium sp.]NUP87283.1 DUF2235 domain-containing protein [Burkholderiaceae bacterium]